MPVHPWLPLAASAALAVVLTSSPARAQLTMVESGFISAHLSDDFAKQIELGVGPGGGSDTCLYYGSFEGLKRRCAPNGPATICDPSLTFPAGIAFSTGGSFGVKMYVADYVRGDIFRSTG